LRTFDVWRQMHHQLLRAQGFQRLVLSLLMILEAQLVHRLEEDVDVEAVLK
jgi:hypothetical protein